MNGPKETSDDEHWIDTAWRIRSESRAYERDRTIDAFNQIADRVSKDLENSYYEYDRHSEEEDTDKE